MKGYDTEDTICALSTAPGVGAIAVLRLSGAKAIEITDKVFVGKKLAEQPTRTLHLGKILAGEEEIDEVVVGLFRAPHSYTGEDIVEISCHGSMYVQGEILKLLMDLGARLAKEGEFTLRAFLNAKLDLSQAEAVADLIASDSKASKDLALNQLRGGYSDKLKELRGKLIDFASMLELELDFSEEDVAFANRDELKQLIEKIRDTLNVLMTSFDQGNVMKNGVPVAIIGKPNVGKSTLLNHILQEEKAIVSEIPGTTRDLIEDEISIGGIMFRFIDTAGLRDTSDKVESIGIERARKKASSARIVLQMTDAEEVATSENPVAPVFSEDSGRLELMVVNKIDKIDPLVMETLKQRLGDKNVFYISAKQGMGVDTLLDRLLAFINTDSGIGGDVIVSSVRHLEALQRSDEALSRALEGLKAGLSSELVAMDVRQALHYLGEITGEVTNEDLLGNIFSRFCIGK